VLILATWLGSSPVLLAIWGSGMFIATDMLAVTRVVQANEPLRGYITPITQSAYSRNMMTAFLLSADKTAPVLLSKAVGDEDASNVHDHSMHNNKDICSTVCSSLFY
jgi:hypothetical protein